ncbi:MAG: hypothetical protein AB1646_06280 [Thermodesulfobacteriota bacterium]
MSRFARTSLFTAYFVFLAGVGVVLGCYIHGSRVNQGTLMSGVQFARELPCGEAVVGYTETLVFSLQEWLHRRQFEKNNPVITIDPKVKEEQDRLFRNKAE